MFHGDEVEAVGVGQARRNRAMLGALFAEDGETVGEALAGAGGEGAGAAATEDVGAIGIEGVVQIRDRVLVDLVFECRPCRRCRRYRSRFRQLAVDFSSMRMVPPTPTRLSSSRSPVRSTVTWPKTWSTNRALESYSSLGAAIRAAALLIEIGLAVGVPHDRCCRGARRASPSSSR